MKFSGILAVLDRPSASGRTYESPAAGWAEDQPPVALYVWRPGPPQPITGISPAEGEHAVGIIDRLWIEDGLLQYSGTLDDTLVEPSVISAIKAGDVVGLFDSEELVSEETEGGWLVHGWGVVGAALGPADRKRWPEVTLALDEISSPAPR